MKTNRDLSALEYSVRDDKIKRVIIDTDAACEADDPFAIAHALLCKTFDVLGIMAEHFGKGTTLRSYEEIKTVLNAMNMNVPVLMGEDGPLSECGGAPASEAADFLIEQAMCEDDKPLFVLCMGALTNVAAALRKNPLIAKKMTVVWIGGHGYDVVTPNHREFNCGNDVEAVNVVMSSGTELWQIPNNVYGTMHIGLAEIQRRIYPCGEIGKHLFENMISFSKTNSAHWIAGESWSLGDSPAVGVVLEPNCGGSIWRTAPVVREDTSYELRDNGPMIKVYTSINSRFILEDFICKLELVYGEK